MTASDIFEKEKTALFLHMKKIEKPSENVNSYETRHLSKSLGKINKKKSAPSGPLVYSFNPARCQSTVTTHVNSPKIST
jgi:hypothetical protein